MSTPAMSAQRIGALLADPPANPISRLLVILRSDPRAMAIAFVGTLIASLAALARKHNGRLATLDRGLAALHHDVAELIPI